MVHPIQEFWLSNCIYFRWAIIHNLKSFSCMIFHGILLMFIWVWNIWWQYCEVYFLIWILKLWILILSWNTEHIARSWKIHCQYIYIIHSCTLDVIRIFWVFLSNFAIYARESCIIWVGNTIISTTFHVRSDENGTRFIFNGLPKFYLSDSWYFGSFVKEDVLKYFFFQMYISIW